jgi:hypothetical protein
MAQYPIHEHGTLSLLPSTTIATFAIGTFLENIAVRPNGTLLITNMTGGNIYYINQNHPDPQSSVLEIHNFNSKPATTEAGGAYGSGNAATAIVEDPFTPDVFYTISGQHGKAGTWAVFKVDLRAFNPEFEAQNNSIEKVVEIPDALWLNGATMIPSTHTLLITESIQPQIIAVHIPSGTARIWLEDELLRKITDRPPWPAGNGIQFFRGKIFVTNSDRAIVLEAQVDEEGNFVEGSLNVAVTNLTGDDLAFDELGNGFIATNPAQTVLRINGLGVGKVDDERVTLLGGPDVAETAGPTAVAFGRGSKKEEGALYVVTTGGLVVAVNGQLELARVVRVQIHADGATGGW